jgi:hypothetical protein
VPALLKALGKALSKLWIKPCAAVFRNRKNQLFCIKARPNTPLLRSMLCAVQGTGAA